MKRHFLIKSVRSVGFLLLFCLGIQGALIAQGVSVYQYRHVPAENVAEFIHRETAYWSQIAQKGIDDGKMEFWALLEKVSVYDLQNTSNFLFINTFANLDEGFTVWDAGAVFPDVPMNAMDTSSLGKVTSTLFVRPENWVQAEGAGPEDFRFAEFVYHDASDPDQLIALENEHWAPFIKSAMDNNQTPMKGWGNGTILSPLGEDLGATTISYDLYPTLHDAVAPVWHEDTVFPEDDLAGIMELETGQRSTVIYRVVHALQAPPAE